MQPPVRDLRTPRSGRRGTCGRAGARGRAVWGRPIYFSDVIVHKDSPIRSFIDLRGRSWAYNERLSHSGYGITRYHLVQLGETNGFLGEVVEAGFHQEAIRLVARKEVDGSAIDSQVLAVELRDHPDLANDIRVVEALGPSTIQPVAVSRRVPKDLREAIRDVLVTLAESPGVRERLALGLVERFEAVDAESFDDIRMMVDACEAGVSRAPLGRDGLEQTSGRRGDLVDRTVERFSIPSRRFPEPAHLPDELKRRGPDLLVVGRHGALAQPLDAPTHVTTVPCFDLGGTTASLGTAGYVRSSRGPPSASQTAWTLSNLWSFGSRASSARTPTGALFSRAS